MSPPQRVPGKQLPRGRGVVFVLFARGDPVDKVVESFRHRAGVDPEFIAETGGGLLVGPLPDGRKVVRGDAR